jgi:2-polyprenyl-3-methyl-5-hydroxy-6-metoxy-1,4-benzoquinol methylase
MTMSVAESERGVYESVWRDIDRYGDHSPGVTYVPFLLEMARPETGATVLDAGCGSGKGALALAEAGLQVTLCDLTPEGLAPEAQELPFTAAILWQPLRHIQPRGVGGRFDFAYCCDVLEHIPTEYTMLVIARLLAEVRAGVFLSIALVPDSFGVFVGQPLHQTVREFTWWRDRIAELGTLVECRDLGTTGLYYVRPTR